MSDLRIGQRCRLVNMKDAPNEYWRGCEGDEVTILGLPGCEPTFADTGLGKTRMQIAWANTVHRETGRDCLILAPLAVAPQTVAEGESMGVKITHCLDGADARPGINIANYERLHRLDPSRFGAVVLDESSCIKHHETKTLKALIERIRKLGREPINLTEKVTR